MRVEDRPPMEVVLARYRAFQADLFAQLEERFGKRHWYQFDKFSTGDCDDEDPDDAEEVYLPAMTFDGVYPAELWKDVRDLVVRVGKEHGFSHITWMVDKPGEDLDFFGHDLENGGRYHFGMAKTTILSIQTGCHLWAENPAPSP